jgi:pimeloyl-ACP methyl ester carboxylesterase
VVLAGHSLGASLASSVAVDHPELVKALVIVDPAYGFTPASPSFLPEFTTRRVMSIPANVLSKTYVNHADAPERVFREPEAHAFLSRR